MHQARKRNRPGPPGSTRRATAEAGMLRPDRWRQIDAVIDYFGGTRKARAICSVDLVTPSADWVTYRWSGDADPFDAASAVRVKRGRVLATDGPFAETREHPGETSPPG